MSNRTDRYSLQRGMTFLELLIVLVIVGMGWFTLMPNLNLAKNKDTDVLSRVNTLIYKARTIAIADDERQILSIDFKDGIISWDEEKEKLPSEVSSGLYNDEPAGDDGIDFVIYPEGFCDEVRLVLNNGMTLWLDVLSGRFREM